MFEQFIALFTRAVVALEKIAGGALNVQDTPAPEAPAKPAGKGKGKQAEAPTPPAEDDFLGGDSESEKDPEPTYERADVKKALQEYGAKHGMPEAQKLFKDASGVTSLSDLPIEKFAAVINATKKSPKK